MASRTDGKDNDIYSATIMDEQVFYEQSIQRMRSEINRGKTFEQACRSLSSDERYLQKEIGEDFLRIIIAEQHFAGGFGIDDIALMLDVSYEKVLEVRDLMLSDLSGALDEQERRWPGKDLCN
ncbi:MAG: hypothetical protein RQ753_01685 [Desulfurivibrionaceae bacterium]|nr:hypothetical protein [Desulfobulbales bacterium]MDT8334386.1 hypothetical protein [Desulfurivibrionaceae bacterium]